MGFPLAALQSAATGANGGVPAFIGATALVLTGFLVLARLSQRVVDDVGDAPAAASAGEARDVSPADGPHDAPPAGEERNAMPAEEARDASPAEVERNTPRAEADREPVSVGALPIGRRGVTRLLGRHGIALLLGRHGTALPLGRRGVVRSIGGREVTYVPGRGGGRRLFYVVDDPL